MPLISITTNAAGVPADSRRALAMTISELFSSHLKTSPAHTHVQILQGQFLCFGGDCEAPAASVTIKAAEGSISKEARKVLVAGISTALVEGLAGLAGERIYMTFEELPVQNFAVGDSIMTFDTMHTAKSIENFADIAP